MSYVWKQKGLLYLNYVKIGLFIVVLMAEPRCTTSFHHWESILTNLMLSSQKDQLEHPSYRVHRPDRDKIITMRLELPGDTSDSVTV